MPVLNNIILIICKKQLWVLARQGLTEDKVTALMESTSHGEMINKSINQYESFLAGDELCRALQEGDITEGYWQLRDCGWKGKASLWW